MKTTAPILVLLFCLTGCVGTGGSKQLSADKLTLLKPGTTTRAEMNEWFGAPISIGLDTSGKSSASWIHSRVIAAPFYTSIRQQMLIAIFETNNVLHNFNLSDPIKATNTPAPVARSPKDAR